MHHYLPFPRTSLFAENRAYLLARKSEPVCRLTFACLKRFTEQPELPLYQSLHSHLVAFHNANYVQTRLIPFQAKRVHPLCRQLFTE